MTLNTKQKEALRPLIEEEQGYMHKHPGERSCIWSDDAWYYIREKNDEVVRCLRKDHPSRAVVEAWFSQNAKQPEEAPELKIDYGVLDFPEKGLRWPVPMMVYAEIVNFSRNMQAQGVMAERSMILQRLGTVHFEATKNDDGTTFLGYCEECGKRSDWPCDTMLLAMDQTRQQYEESTMTDGQPEGIQIETKEGQVSQEMTTSDQGVQHPGTEEYHDGQASSEEK